MIAADLGVLHVSEEAVHPGQDGQVVPAGQGTHGQPHGGVSDYFTWIVLEGPFEEYQ